MTHFLDSPISLDHHAVNLVIKPLKWNNRSCLRFEVIACGKFFIIFVLNIDR